jgi:hypothetical protein
LILDEESNVAIHKPIPTKKGDIKPGALENPEVTSLGLAAETGQPEFDDGKAPEEKVQEPVGPDRFVTLQGYAKRLGYRIPVPELKSFGGVDVIRISRQSAEKIDGAIAGLPVWHMAWSVTYRLPKAPKGDTPFFADPSLGTDGGKGVKPAK